VEEGFLKGVAELADEMQAGFVVPFLVGEE